MADIIISPVDLTGLDIPIDTGGIITPGAAFAIDMAAQVINATWNQANTKAAAFETKISDIETWLPEGTPANISAGTATSPAVVEPAVDIPASADTADVMALFDSKYAELVALLVDKFTNFRATYFPDDGVAYAAVEDWLQAALANPDAGLPVAVVDQLLTDAKDKIVAESSRATDSVMQTFAARRYPLPPGAALAATTQIQMTAQNNIAEAGRKITVASIDNLKNTMDKLIGLRQLAMSSAIEYIKALASGPDMASRVVGIGYDAQSKLIGAASQFYGVRADVAKIATQNSQFNVTSALQAAEKNQIKELTLVEDRLKALLTEAQALAQMATSMFNNLHASSGSGYSVNGT